jgi:rhamnose transport system substrate-binding protein
VKNYRKLLIVLLTLTLLGLISCTGTTPAEPAAEKPAAEEPAAAEKEEPAAAESSETLKMVLMPKFLGILVFDQANEGAMEANAELGNPVELEFLGPTPENSVAGQIEIVTTATTQGVDAIMISNNAGDQLAPAAQAAADSGMTVVTWDSPIPSAEGEQVFIAQVDFDETGTVMADMALSILGDDGGKFAVLSASPDAANQNAWIAAMEETLKDPKYASLELLDIVYGNDQSEDSYNQALALVDKYPDMELIMAPTTVGIAAAAKAMQDEGLCDTVKVSGLGLPAEMVSYTLNGCAPEFALWSFVDLGYLTFHTTYLLATGQIEAKEGQTFEAGRMGTYTIEKDPTRDAGLRVLMGPFTVYNAGNVEAAAGGEMAAEEKPAEGGAMAEVVKPQPGLEMNAVLLPKFLGILVFDQANEGAQEAAAELDAQGDLEFLGPTPENSVAGQIEIVTTATTQGMDAIMISNNAGDQLAPAAQAAVDAGMTVVTWDSPIPSAEGEQVFIAQVDFDETGQVMADMALSILGDDGGKFAVLSASPDAANQNAWIAAMEEALQDPKYASLELLDIVYGNDQSEDSYNQALALVDKYPDMELIMAPTTVGIAAASKAMQDEGLCDTVKVSGLGLPAEMVSYTLNGCAPEFALWSFVDLGYLTYYTTYLLATGQMEAAEGVSFEAGRMGTYTIEKDPTRDAGLRVLMGPFTVYNKDNVEAAAGGAEVASAGEAIVAEPGAELDMVLMPKFLGILVFDQANAGAQEAAAELETNGDLEFLGPTPENSVAGQIEILTTATTQGVNAIMISNNAGDQLAPAAQAARDSGMTVVTWDSPIPSAEGEQVFIAQVDFDETGTVMADMALSILGDDGGKFAVLSASPDAANQNAWIAAMEEALKDPKYASLELLDIVYGNDQSEDSYNQALALVDKYPDMELIMAPTTVGIAAASKAMQDEGLCDTVKVSGLGLPAEMVSYTLNGCAPEFALWSFVDLGYLTYYTTYLIASGQMEAKEGVTFEAGRMGTYTIEKDPTRDQGLRVLMGPFTVYNKDNVEAAAK